MPLTDTVVESHMCSKFTVTVTLDLLTTVAAFP